jgi:hypothetical protein
MSFGVLANGNAVGNIVDRSGSHSPFFDPLTGQLTTSAILISGPIDLAASIEAQIGLTGLSALSNSFFTTAGTVDFAETATLSGIEVFDANGNPLSDFTVSSQSGTHYPLSSPAVAFPNRWALRRHAWVGSHFSIGGQIPNPINTRWLDGGSRRHS